ncbi:MAG: NINE protein [Phycisphaerales bacterium]|nr:MAG: NINE protein [Phycisphaerales bacterium]
MKDRQLAYILNAIGFLGFAGIHGIYCRKYITGLLWFFTLGFLYIGTIIDFFLIRGMVDRANRRLAAP